MLFERTLSFLEFPDSSLACYELNHVSFQIHMLKPESLVLQKVTVVGYKAFEEVLTLKQMLNWALIQCDVFL